MDFPYKNKNLEEWLVSYRAVPSWHISDETIKKIKRLLVVRC